MNKLSTTRASQAKSILIVILALSLAAGGVAVFLFQQNRIPPAMPGYDPLCPPGAIDPILIPTCSGLDGLFAWLTVLRGAAGVLIAASLFLIALLLIRRQWGKLLIAVLPLFVGVYLIWLSQQALATYWRLSVTPMSDPTSPEQRVARIQHFIDGYVPWGMGAVTFTLIVLGVGLLLLKADARQRPQVASLAPVM